MVVSLKSHHGSLDEDRIPARLPLRREQPRDVTIAPHQRDVQWLQGDQIGVRRLAHKMLKTQRQITQLGEELLGPQQRHRPADGERGHILGDDRASVGSAHAVGAGTDGYMHSGVDGKMTARAKDQHR